MEIIASDALQNLIAQLVELSERGDIRVTDDGRYSIYDVIEKVTEKNNPHKSWDDLKSKYTEVLTKSENLQFPGAGQRPTPVTDLVGIIEIIWLLPGGFSNKFRNLGAQIVTEVIQQQDESRNSAVGLRAFTENPPHQTA